MHSEGEKLRKSEAALIRSARVARLATVSQAGEPHVVPICFAYDGEVFYSALDAKPKRVPLEQLARVRHIRANPRVCLLIDEYDEDWSKLRYIIVHGEAEVLADGDEHARAVRLLREKYKQYQAMAIDENPVIKIKPMRFVVWRMTPEERAQ